jgi:hypothetical protein
MATTAKSTSDKTCTVGDCDSRHYAKDYCKKHYTQVLRHGDLTPDRERGIVRECKSPGCGRTDTIKWYCRKHARQLRVHGRLTPEREHLMGFEGCKVANCKGEHRARGLCAKHYNQERWKRMKTDRRGGGGKARKAAAKPVRAKLRGGKRKVKR